MLCVKHTGRGLFVLAALATVFLLRTYRLDAADPPAASPGDATAKQRILDSPAWQKALRDYSGWLSVQLTYDKSQVAELNSQLQEKIAPMSAAETQSFLEELQEKLALVLSPEAVEARTWAEGYLNVLNDAKAAEFRKQFPDVARMTPAQIKQAFSDLHARRAGVRATRRLSPRCGISRWPHFAKCTARRPRRQIPTGRSAPSGGGTSGSYAPRAQRTPYVPRPPLSFGFGYRW